MKVNFLSISLLSQKKIVVFLFIFLQSFLSNLRGQCTGASVLLEDKISVCDNQNVVVRPVVTLVNPSHTIDSVKWFYNGSVVSTNMDSLVILLSASNQGYYYMNMWIDSCFTTDSILLGFLNPGLILGSDTICSGQSPNPFFSTSVASIMTGDTLKYVWEYSTDSVNWTSIPGTNLATYNSGSLTQTTYFRRKVELIQNGSVFCFSYSNGIAVEVVSGVTVHAGQDTTICPGNPYTFSGSVSGIGSYQPVYQWSGPGGFSDTTLTPTISSVSQADAGTYVLSATIGSCVLYDTVLLDVYTISINSGQFNPGRTQLVECIGPGSSTGLIGFFPVLPSPSSSIQSVTIDWGDGVVQTIPSSGYSALQTHNYQAGSYSLSITVVVSAGCTTVLTYSVFVGSSPSPASLALFVNQANGCLPHATSFTFNVPSANVDGTTYEVDWGDGSPTVTYTHPNTPPVLNHVYSQSSCGNSVVTSGTTYTNVFQPFVITKNPCSVQPQPSAAGLISVGVPPDASFTVSKEIICPDDEIQLDNTSDFGLSIPTGSGANCDTVSSYYWTITPDNSTGTTNWSIVSGSLGSNNGFPGNPGFWTVGTMTPRVKFLVSGTYVIDLFVENDCGLSQYSDTICVIVPPVCSIELADTAGCSVLTTSVSSSSVFPTCDSFVLPVQYAWSVSNPPGCSGCSSSLASTSSDSSGLTLINNSNSIQYFTVELTVTAIDSSTNSLLSNCESTCSKTIKVYPRVQISPLTSCTGQLNWNLTNQVNVPSSITWQATQNLNVSGETTSLQSSSLITDSLVNNSSSSQTVIYTVIATSIDGGCSDTQVFTVNLLAPIVIQPLSDDTLCVGGTLSSPLVLSYTGGNNPPSYQWRLGGLVVSNSASFTPNTFTAPGNYSFVGSVTYGPPGCRISENDTVVITVVPDPVVTIQPVSDTYCLGASGVDTLVVSASGGLGSYSYQWYSSAINSNSGGTAIPGATTPRFVPSVGSVGTTYYYCAITQTGLNCNVNSATASILVTPAPTFSTQPITSQTICLDGTLSALTVVYQNGTPGGTYQWYSNSANSNTGGTLIPGATNASYIPPSNSTGTFYYYCVVTLTSGGCSSITSNVGVVIVRPHPVISVQPIPSQTICEGGTIDTALFASYSGGVGAPSYQWQKGGVTIPGATNSGYLPPSFNSADTAEFSVIISLSGSGCDSDTSQVGQVIVVEDPIIVNQPDTAVYCQNASPVTPLLVQASGGIGAYSYQWYMDSVNSTYSASQLISGATNSSFVPFVDSVGVFYYYCVVSQTGLNCGVVSDTVKIIVTEGPTFSTQPIDTQTICLDGTLSPLTVVYQNGTPGGTYQWYSNTTNSNTGGTLIPGATNASYTPPSNATGIFYYYCVVTLPSGGCSSITSNVGVVIVRPDPVISVQPIPSQTICEGGTIDTALFASYSGGVGVPSYQWQKGGVTIRGATNSGYLPPSFNSADTAEFSVIISLSGSGCDSDTSQVGRVIVIDDPLITLQPVPANYCENGTPVDTLKVSAQGGLGSFSYQWFSNSSNSNSGGVPILGATDSTFVPPVNSVGATYYYCVISQSGLNCEAVSLPALIFVTPGPTFTNQPIDTQIVCIDGIVNSLSVNYLSGFGQPSYQWFVNSVNSNSGGTLLVGDTNSSYMPSTDSSGTKFYYCEVSFNSGGCSKIVSEVGAIIVRSEPIINVQPLSNDSICVGGTIGTPLTLNYTGGAGVPSYQWKEFGVDIPGATASSFSPSNFSSTGTYLYTVVLSLSGSGCDADTSQDATILVVPDPIVTIQPVSDTYCLGASGVDTLVVSASGGLGSYNYQWYSSAINSNSGGTAIPGATTPRFVPSVGSVGTTYYYCAITQTGLNCNVSSATATILVTTAPTFSTQPIISQTICLDGTLSPLTVVYQNGTPGGTYQWYSNSANSNTGGTLIPGATNASYTPPSNSTGTLYYYCVVTLPSGGCSSITSNVGIVIVRPDPVISVQPIPSQTICEGGTIDTALFASYSGGVGVPSYQWQKGGVTIRGATNSGYLPPSFNSADTAEFSVIISLSGSGCDSDTSQNGEVIIISDPVVSLQPTSASYCQNASPVASLVVQALGGLGSYSYQWYRNTTNSNSGGLLLPGETDSTFVPPVSLVGTTYYYCEIVQTGLNCNVTSSTASIIVTPAPTFTTQPIDTQTVCLDGSLSALTVAYQNGVGSPTYQWYSNSINSYTGSTLIIGATNLNYLPPTDSVGTFYYYCVVTLPNGGCSSITSDIAVVIVLPDPMISIQPIPAQTICEGGTILNPLTVSYAGGVGTPSYQWQNSGVNIVGANSASFTPSGISSPGIYSYSVIVNLSGNGCNADTSQNSLITVIPDPIVVVQPVSDTYCIGAVPVDTLVVSANGGLGMFSYQWYSNTTNSNTGGTPILGATDSTFVPSVGIVGTLYYYCEITQTGINCNTVSLPATIVVNPAPTFATQPIDSQSVCLDGLLTSLNVTYQNGVGTPSYQWFVNSSNSYSGSVPVIGATNSNYLPLSTVVGTFYYYCVVSLSKGGCSSIVSDIAKVIVNPDPLITVQPLLSQTICVGGTLAAPFSVGFSGGVGNPSYQWQKNGVNLLGDTNSSFLPTTFFVPDTIDYRVILSLDGSGCNVDTSLNAEVIIVNDPVMVREPDSAIYCENTSPVTPLLVRSTGGLGNFNYQWYSNSVNSNSGGTMIPGATDSTFIPPVSVVGTVYYYCEISQSGLNCNVTSAAAKITITPSPSFSNQPIGFQKLCIGGTSNLLSVSYIGGNNSVSYQWYQNNVNSNVGGTPLVGQTSSSFLPPSSTTGSNFYYCVLSFSVGGCSSIASNPAEVVVVDDPIITNQPVLSQMICQGTTILQPLTFSFSGGTGATSIAWYQFGTPNVLINGVTDTSFLPITFNSAGNFKYFAVVTDSGVGCDNTSTLNSEIIVNPTPRVNPLSDTVLCNDSRLNIQITTSVPSNIAWSATQNINVTGELTSTQTSTLIDDSLTNNTTIPQFVEYTITPTSFPEGCPGPDSIVRVKLQPDVVLNNVPNVEICSGSPVNTILTANVPSTFNWFVSIDNPNVTGESLFPSTSNLITDRLVNNTSVNQIVVYSVFPVSIEGQCAGLAQTFVVTVKPSLALLNEDTLTICSGERVNLAIVANTNVTFNWYADQSVNVVNETTSVVSSSLINDSLVNISNSVESVTYHVVGTSTSNGCSSPVIPITVYVNPVPSVFPIQDTTVCNGVTLSPISFNGPVVGTNYNWSVSDTSIGVGTSLGVNSVPGFITVNPTSLTKSVSFTVSPIFINDSISCVGETESFILSVLPSPDVYSLPDISVCNGIQVPQNILAGSVPGTIFNWSNSNTSISLNSGGIGSVPSFNATNITAVQQFSNVTVTPMIQQGSVQCFGVVENYTITVNPTPFVQNSDVEICSGENTNLLLNSNIPSSFTWVATPTSTVFNETSFPIQTSVLIDDTLSILTPTPQEVDYTVTPTSLPHGCVGPDSVIKVKVNPLPSVSFNVLNTVFCDLQPINFQNNSVGSLNFDWSFGDGNTSFLFNPSNTYAVSGNYSIKLKGTNPLTGCSDSSVRSITISETPNSRFSYSDSAGCDKLSVLFTADSIDLTASYLWDFGNGSTSQQKGVAGHQYTVPDCYDVKLTVTSKEGCESSTLDTSAICLYEQPIADFMADRILFSSLETPEVQFTNLSQFSTVYSWDFGDNQFAITENPIHTYSDGANVYQVKLISSNNIGCKDSVMKTIRVFQDIGIYVPNTFTPNRDEINQVFLPILTDGFVEETYHLTIFNKWGELVFETRELTEGWDGNDAKTETYIWKIAVDVKESSERKFFMGHVNLIR
jgi:gliding motility-associated-like protein